MYRYPTDLIHSCSQIMNKEETPACDINEEKTTGVEEIATCGDNERMSRTDETRHPA